MTDAEAATAANKGPAPVSTGCAVQTGSFGMVPINDVHDCGMLCRNVPHFW